MGRARGFAFEPFYLDVLDERVWRHDVSVSLGHKAFGMLAHLVGQANRLVTKDDLLASVWPDTAVSEAVLTTAMREIRRALGDSTHTPRFIQTVYGRGYRFIAPVVETHEDPSPAAAAGEGRCLVGREDELARLHTWYAAALHGHRRIGFIAGDAGIGKTALVDAFAAEVAATRIARIGRGQCIEQYGAGEAYLPILEALEGLGRDAELPLARAFRDRAPSWLEHLPVLASHERPPSAVGPERMLRELTLALEALTTAAPLIIVLEDLHWSDNATVEWLASVARRRDPARLLVLGTYRPIDALVQHTPLRDVLAELRHQPQAGELVLDCLSRDAVHTYLQRVNAGVPDLDDLANVLHRRTGGHPLFLASMVDDLSTNETDAHTIPVNVRQFIERRLEQLSDEDQRIFEAASVAGDPFSIAAVAAATSLSEEQIEARCAAWTRAHRLLTADGMVSWPDGTLAAGFRFRHALFHEVAYARISPERRARLHLLIGNRLEAAYGKQVSSIAAELAVHFEQGRDVRRTVRYLEQSAQNAMSRSAYGEAERHLVRALAVAEQLPEGRQRLRHEATLSLLLAHVLETRKGWSADDVERCFSRARERCLALRDEPRLLQATWGLIAVSVVRAELHNTRALSQDMLTRAKKRGNVLFRMAAHVELGGTALMLGRTRSAGRHFRLAEVLSDTGRDRSIATFGMDLGIFGRMWATHLTWFEGYPERARDIAARVMAEACAIDHPFTRTVAFAYAAMLGQFRRDIRELDRLSAAAIAQATEHGFPYYLAWAEVLRSWSLVAQGAGEPAVADMRRSITVLQTTAGLRLPYYRALLAEACGRIGRIEEGLEAVSAAFEDLRTSDERWWEAELHRTRGELLRLATHDEEAEQYFRRAIDIAGKQRAKVLELRAAVSLARLWQGQRKTRAARSVLAPIYGWFAEGSSTADLTAARSLLDKLR